MSSLPASSIQGSSLSHVGLTRPQLAAISCLLAIFAVAGIPHAVFSLWLWWTSDGLNSIGMLVPPVSFVLILRVWRQLDWEQDGSWWGLVIMVATAILVRVREQALILLVLSPKLTAPFPPPALVMFAFGSGLVLLTGGTRLYRAALFPISLLWLVNPFPHTFSVLVDLPLQHVSAHLARAFAVALGQKLTPDSLRLMFTPEFGMFIAPGCNGIRGAVTMGLIALVAGYLYRFRWFVHAMVVVGAVMLGYAFNLIRLCALVLYYLLALHIPWLQSRATAGDYILGALLFLVATLLLFLAIERCGGAADARNRDAADGDFHSPEPRNLQSRPSRMQHARLATLAALGIYGCTGIPRVSAELRPDVIEPADASAAELPAHIGAYRRLRTWNETLSTGLVVYVWAQYALPGGGTPISLGLSPVLGPHDAILCHFARGEDALWRSDNIMPTAGRTEVNFNTAFYANGSTQELEASTLCTQAGCGEFAAERTHFGFVYSRPDAETLLATGIHRPIPWIIRIEMDQTVLPADTARDEMTQAIRGFVGNVDFDALMRAHRRP